MIDRHVFCKGLHKINKCICRSVGIKYTFGCRLADISRRLGKYKLHIYLKIKDTEDKKTSDVLRNRNFYKLYDINVNKFCIDPAKVVIKQRKKLFVCGTHSYVELTEDELLKIFALLKVSR